MHDMSRILEQSVLNTTNLIENSTWKYQLAEMIRIQNSTANCDNSTSIVSTSNACFSAALHVNPGCACRAIIILFLPSWCLPPSYNKIKQHSQLFAPAAVSKNKQGREGIAIKERIRGGGARAGRETRASKMITQLLIFASSHSPANWHRGSP